MLWLIRDGNKKVPVFTGTFWASRSTNGYICQFSLQQQEAEPDPGSRAEPHSLNSTSFETTDSKKQHFHSGNSKKVWEGHDDDDKLIQGTPLSSLRKKQQHQCCSHGLTFALGRRQQSLGHLDLSFSSSDIQKQGQLRNGQSLATGALKFVRDFWSWNSVFSSFKTLQNQLCFLVGTAHKKGSWSF